MYYIFQKNIIFADMITLDDIRKPVTAELEALDEFVDRQFTAEGAVSYTHLDHPTKTRRSTTSEYYRKSSSNPSQIRFLDSRGQYRFSRYSTVIYVFNRWWSGAGYH